jgi:hypothetical protein
MAATPEAKVKAAIKAFLKSLSDCFFFSPIGGPYAQHGIPDIVVSLRGKFVGIEVKAPGKEKNTTQSQDYILGCIRNSGGVAFVASDVDTVKNQLFLAGLLVP